MWSGMDNKSIKRGSAVAAILIFLGFVLGIAGGPLQSCQAIQQFRKDNPWFDAASGFMTQYLNDHGAMVLILCVGFFGFFVLIDPDRPKFLNWSGRHSKRIILEQRHRRRHAKHNRFGLEAVKGLMIAQIDSSDKYEKRFSEVLSTYLDKPLVARPAPSNLDFSTMVSHDLASAKANTGPHRIPMMKFLVDKLIDPCVQSGELKVEHRIHATTVFRYEIDQWSKKMGLPRLKGWQKIPPT
jgi:hypothetical protein